MLRITTNVYTNNLTNKYTFKLISKLDILRENERKRVSREVLDYARTISFETDSFVAYLYKYSWLLAIAL